MVTSKEFSEYKNLIFLKMFLNQVIFTKNLNFKLVIKLRIKILLIFFKLFFTFILFSIYKLIDI